MCMHQKEALKYMRQTLTNLKGEIDKSTIKTGDFRTLLSVIELADRKSGSR